MTLETKLEGFFLVAGTRNSIRDGLLVSREKTVLDGVLEVYAQVAYPDGSRLRIQNRKLEV